LIKKNWAGFGSGKLFLQQQIILLLTDCAISVGKSIKYA